MRFLPLGSRTYVPRRGECPQDSLRGALSLLAQPRGGEGWIFMVVFRVPVRVRMRPRVENWLKMLCLSGLGASDMEI